MASNGVYDELGNLIYVNNDVIQKGQKVGYSSPLPSLTNNSLSTSRTGGSGTTSSQFEFSKYDVAGLSYPIDLLGNNADQEPKNYVIFYINVSVDSKVVREKTEEVVTGVTRDLRGDLVGRKYTPGPIDVLSQYADKTMKAITGKNTVTPEDVPPAEEKYAAFTRPQKRLKKAIALHIPNNIKADYNVSYGEVDTAGFQVAAKGREELGNVLSGEKSSMKQLATDVATAIGLKATDKIKGLAIGAGLAVNPKKEQAFESVDFRKFTFTYQFAPKNSAEARSILNIIREFKYHMHPEFKEPSAFTYIYPSEFDIVYYFGTNENLNLHRHTSCVLTSMDVDYSPLGIFSTFDDGMPTQINVSLTFKELMVLSKETIERGL